MINANQMPLVERSGKKMVEGLRGPGSELGWVLLPTSHRSVLRTLYFLQDFRTCKEPVTLAPVQLPAAFVLHNENGCL
jgi:hypothetical protein